MRADRLSTLQKCNSRDLAGFLPLTDVRVVTVFRGNYGDLQWEDGQLFDDWVMHVFLPKRFTNSQIDNYVAAYNHVGELYN